MRNRHHHEGYGSDAAYVVPAQVLAERLDEVLVPMASDCHSTVLVVKGGTDVGEEGSTYKYDLIELRADSANLPRAMCSSDQRLEEKKVYLLHSGNFIDADPLVRYEICLQCNSEEAFFLDHFAPASPEWLSYRGHRIS